MRTTARLTSRSARLSRRVGTNDRRRPNRAREGKLWAVTRPNLFEYLAKPVEDRRPFGDSTEITEADDDEYDAPHFTAGASSLGPDFIWAETIEHASPTRIRMTMTWVSAPSVSRSPRSRRPRRR